jgi:Icc-related predicted phosphoesterase
MKIYYLCFPANDDLAAFDKVFEETCNKYTYVKYIAQKRVEINGYEFIGFNWVPDFPFLLKDRCRMDDKKYKVGYQKGKGIYSREDHFEEITDWEKTIKTMPTIEEELEKLEKPKDISKTIYIMHAPPVNLGLDVCLNGKKVGSKAIFRFIKKYQPLMTLHGHIHESPYVTGVWHKALGKTICIQPGQEGHMENFIYITVNFNNMELKRYSL